MADIRQDPTIKDNFNRAPEDPLSNGGKWAAVDTGFPTMVGAAVLGQDVARHRVSQSCWSYWTPDPAMDGDAAECWARTVGGQSPGNAWGLAILSSPGGTNQHDGYLFRIEQSSGGGFWRLWRADNAVYMSIAGPTAGGLTGILMLIKRNGNDVEGWTSSDSGSSWTLRISATDITYTTGFYPVIHTDQSFSSINIGLDDFGAGPAEEFIPQIYRRVFA